MSSDMKIIKKNLLAKQMKISKFKSNLIYYIPLAKAIDSCFKAGFFHNTLTLQDCPP